MYRTLVQYPAVRRRKEGGEDGRRLSLLLSLMEFFSRIEHGQKKAEEIYIYAACRQAVRMASRRADSAAAEEEEGEAGLINFRRRRERGTRREAVTLLFSPLSFSTVQYCLFHFFLQPAERG